MSRSKKVSRSFLPFLVYAATVILIPNVVLAGITFNGDYSPADSADWVSGATCYLGYNTAGTGTVAVASGSTLTTGYSYLGYASGSSGTLSVSDSGSSWNPMRIYIGWSGSGLLNVTGGSVVVDSGLSVGLGGQTGGAGTLTVAGGYFYSESLYVGSSNGGTGLAEFKSGATGQVSRTTSVGNVGGSSGTLTVSTNYDFGFQGNSSILVGGGGTGTFNITSGAYVTAGNVSINQAGALYFGGGNLSIGGAFQLASGGNVSGTGNILSKGLVSDLNLTIDSTTGNRIRQTIGGNVMLTVNCHDPYIETGVELGIGYQTGGTLLLDGQPIASVTGSVGRANGAAGTATVVGGGTWTLMDTLTVGGSGCGNSLLQINNGTVRNNPAQNGTMTIGTNGTVTVDGPNASVDWNRGKPNTDSDIIHVGKDSSYETLSGLLQINNGGVVTARNTSLGSAGTLSFGGATSGTLNTTTLILGAATNITGTGSIVTHGVVSNLDLVFDNSPTHGTTHQMITIPGVPDTQVDLTVSNASATGILGVGTTGSATMTISNGAVVYSSKGVIGLNSSASGTATVDGGSWLCSGKIGVGVQGSGTLFVRNGGIVAATAFDGEGMGTGMIYVDGGTLQATANESSFLSSKTTGYIGNNGATIDTNGYDIKISQPLAADTSSTGGLVKAGLGVLTLAGTNTYAGSTAVNQGTLRADYMDSLPSYGSAGKLTVANGAALALPTYYAEQKRVFIPGQGFVWITIEHGWSSTAITDLLGANSAGFASGSVLALDTGTGSKNVDFTCDASMAGNYGLSVTGTKVLTLTGTNSYTGPTTIGTGTTAFANKGAMAAWDNPNATTTVSVAGSATLAVHVSNTDSTRWSAADLATLAAGNAGTNTGAVTFNSGSSLGIDTSLGDFTCDIALPLTGTTGVTKLGDNMLIFGGTQTYAGSTTVKAGTLLAITPDALSGYDQAGRITVQANAAVGGRMSTSGGPGWTPADFVALFNANGANIVGSLAIDTTNGDYVYSDPLPMGSTGVGVLKLGNNTLTLSGANTYTGLTTVRAGELKLGVDAQNPVLNFSGADVQSGKLVFVHTGGTETGGQIRDILDGGYDTDFTSGQIFSSTAQANGKALGWVDDGSEVTVMYTLYGDSNLDGSVNGSDLNAVLSSYNLSGQVWADGDFNYDGSVNGEDLNTVLSNYNQSLPASTAAVPEPSTLLLMVLGLVGLLAYRRVRACTHQ